MTSGIDGLYPKGFVIGTVERVERGDGLYHVIRVRPAVDFSRLEEVLVVLTPAAWPRGGRGEGRSRELAGAAALAAALVLQTTLTGMVRGARRWTWCWSWWWGRRWPSGRSPGLVTGTIGGLIQDALSSGILGMGGLAKTLVGFAAGQFGTQFIVTATVPRLLVFAAAPRSLHAALFMGLYMLLGLRSFPDSVRRRGDPGRRQRRGRGGRGPGGGRRLPGLLERRRAAGCG